MRVRALVFLLAAAASTGAYADEYAITEQGRRVLLKSDGSWVAAPWKITAKDALDFSNADEQITKTCEKDWPADPGMRPYCQRKQRDGLQALQQPKPATVGDDAFQTVRMNCAEAWPGDYSMRAYCERQQLQSVKDLQK